MVERALDYIASQENEFGSLVERRGVCRAIYITLYMGGFNLQDLHKTGDLRKILDILL